MSVKEQTMLDRLTVWVWWLMVVVVLLVSPFFSFSSLSNCPIDFKGPQILTAQTAQAEQTELSSQKIEKVSFTTTTGMILLVGLVLYNGDAGHPFPWQPRRRFKKWALARFREARKAAGKAYWRAKLAYLLLRGSLPMAGVVDLVTEKQLQRHLGALPVLYTLLEQLQVRQIINTFCPTKAQVDHGTVALVLVLNRLHAPRPLWRITDWLAETVLVNILAVPATKFNDDRLARTLDALSLHKREIWLAISQQALQRFNIDKRFLFYDLTAFVMQGAYQDSDLVEYGFAHNTPSNKQKVKTGLTVTADGAMPLDFEVYSGSTADQATVQDNLKRLREAFEKIDWPLDQTIVVTDRAGLNSQLAHLYHEQQINYLSGLQPRTKEHKELLKQLPASYLEAHPLTKERGRYGYYGLMVPISFEHEEERVEVRALIVLSGPMRHAKRAARAQQIRQLIKELEGVQDKIGKPYYRSIKAVEQRANTKVRNSKVGHLFQVEAYLDENEKIALRWQIDRFLLKKEMDGDGRYLLVTNDPTLTARQILQLYRDKDAVEKRFRVCKQALKVRPIYLHKDHRIEAMLLVNMIALLAYSLLERQLATHGIQMTTQRLLQKLETVAMIETHCHDGSILYRMTMIDHEQQQLLEVLAQILRDFNTQHLSDLPARALPSSSSDLLPPPTPDQLSTIAG